MSIMAPEGAAGQGGRERHQLKGQCLERKQEGQSRQELKDEGSEDRGEGVSCLRPNGV